MATDDACLLRQYVKQNSQSAFAALTGRYLRLVYGTCLRELGDPALAEDATQIVFLILARRAGSLRMPHALPNWLFTTARLTARQLRKQEHMRQTREQDAFEQSLSAANADPAWPDIAEHINDAVAALGPKDREVVLLRFFDGLSLKEVGDALGITENTARMRVVRSVDKMRRRLAREQVTASADVLTALLGTEAARALPAASAAGIAQTVLQTLAPMGRTPALSAHLMQQTAQGVIRHMVISKLGTVAALAAIGILGITGGIHALQGQAAPPQPSTTAAAAAARPQVQAATRPGDKGTHLTGAQILQRCEDAYHAVNTLDQTAHALSNNLSASAHILFQRPAMLRVSGQTTFPGSPYDMISDGASTSVYNPLHRETQPSAEMGIAAITGISGTSGTVVPAILAHSQMGNISVIAQNSAATVTTDTVNGQPTYCVSFTFPSPRTGGSQQQAYWVNRRTFYLVKTSMQFPGLENTVTYDAPIVDKPLPASAFQR